MNPEAANAHPFQVGEVVGWTAVKGSGGGFSMSAREGKIIELSGGAALVQSRNGRKQWKNLSGLTRKGEKNGVTKFFDAMCHAHGLPGTRDPKEASHGA